MSQEKYQQSRHNCERAKDILESNDMKNTFDYGDLIYRLISILTRSNIKVEKHTRVLEHSIILMQKHYGYNQSTVEEAFKLLAYSKKKLIIITWRENSHWMKIEIFTSGLDKISMDNKGDIKLEIRIRRGYSNLFCK